MFPVLLHKWAYLFTLPHSENIFLNCFQRREAARIHEGAPWPSEAQGSVSTFKHTGMMTLLLGATRLVKCHLWQKRRKKQTVERKRNKTGTDVIFIMWDSSHHAVCCQSLAHSCRALMFFTQCISVPLKADKGCLSAPHDRDERLMLPEPPLPLSSGYLIYVYTRTATDLRMLKTCKTCLKVQ